MSWRRGGKRTKILWEKQILKCLLELELGNLISQCLFNSVFFRNDYKKQNLN